MKTIKTVLLAQRRGDMIDVFAQWIRDAGYRVRVCTGPGGPGNDCWAYTRKDCPYWVQTDLVIYDPWIATSYGGQRMFALERARHPDMPVLFLGSGALPSDVASMEQPGKVEYLPMTLGPQDLVAAIERLVGPPAGAAAGSAQRHRPQHARAVASA